jgi:type IV pilus assembly protein PilA
MNTRSKNNKGFTLVEIMIVVVIIGLLAAMAIPAFQKVRASSQEKAIINNLRQVHSAAQQYFLEHGASTVALTDIVGDGTDKYLKSIQTVAGEIYPATISQTDTVIEATSTRVPGKAVISFAN